MLLRDDPAMAQEGWPLLLDSAVAGRVVLPASPRLGDEPGGPSGRRPGFACAASPGPHLSTTVKPPTGCSRVRPRWWFFRSTAASLCWGGIPVFGRCCLPPAPPCTGLFCSDRRPVVNRFPRAGSSRDGGIPCVAAWCSRDGGRRLHRQGLMADQNALSARLRPLLFPSADTWSRCWSLPPLLPEDRSASGRALA